MMAGVGSVSANALSGNGLCLGEAMAGQQKSPNDPFRWFESSPEVIRLVVLMMGWTGTVKANEYSVFRVEIWFRLG